MGSLEVRVGGQALAPLHSRREHWLLALLILRQGRSLERAWLAGTLWPETEQSQALAYLRTGLAALRKALGPHAALVQSPSRLTLAFDLTGADVDLVAFDAAISGTDTAGLERAVAMYCGPLLEGCDEEWVHQDRQAREQSYVVALEKLAAQATAIGDDRKAAGYLRRVIVVDNLRESAHRDLMCALAADGAHMAEIEVYRELRLHLNRTLNAEPDAATTALCHQIRMEARSGVRKSLPTLPTAPAAHRVPAIPPPPKPIPQRLPYPLTELVGRQEEIRQLQQWVNTTRIVTLTGTGGIGKTRLAIGVAGELGDDFPDGVWFVELASLRAPELLAPTVATRLEVPEAPNRDLTAAMVNFLEARRALLVLDNCEHLIAACAQLSALLLRACPHLKILATSREPLGITGEQIYRVPSLALPSAPQSIPFEELQRYSAIQLFIARARSAKLSFTVTKETAPVLQQVCQRLDGIPLAIELAAARVRSLSLVDLNRRLDDRFELLIGGDRTALPRQQTLRALIDWSYDLLTPEEQRLLAHLAVFMGGWTLEAAAKVCADAEVLDLLTSLVDKSLVIAEDRDGVMRYRMLETVRQYALEKLILYGETADLKAAHHDYYLAEEAMPELTGPDPRRWLKLVETEYANMQAAFAWCLDEADAVEGGLRLCRALQHFWLARGRYSEGMEWCVRALGRTSDEIRTRSRASALIVAGALTFYQGDLAASHIYHEACLSIMRELGDRWGIAMALNGIGDVFHHQGNHSSAHACMAESLAIKREIGNQRGIAVSLGNLGLVAKDQGDYVSARSYYEESLAIRKELNDRGGIAKMLNNLGYVSFRQLDFATAESLYDQSLAICREVGHPSTEAHVFHHLGLLAFERRNYPLAWARLRQGLAIYAELGEGTPLADMLDSLAETLAARGDGLRAANLWGAGASLREALGVPRTQYQQESYDRWVAHARLAVQKDDFAVAREQGRAMPLDQAIEFALQIPFEHE